MHIFRGAVEFLPSGNGDANGDAEPVGDAETMRGRLRARNRETAKIAPLAHVGRSSVEVASAPPGTRHRDGDENAQSEDHDQCGRENPCR